MRSTAKWAMCIVGTLLVLPVISLLVIGQPMAGVMSLVAGVGLILLVVPRRSDDEAEKPLKIEPRLSVPQNAARETLAETQAESGVVCEIPDQAFNCSEIAMWREDVQRLLLERADLRNLGVIEIPGPVSRETLDAVRDVFAPSKHDPDLVVWDAKVESLRINIAAADQVRAVYDRAMLLAGRVTPELLALPIPTAVREILLELIELQGEPA